MKYYPQNFSHILITGKIKKEAEIKIGDTNVKIAVAHGLDNVEYVVNKVREARQKGLELPYHFIEVMARMHRLHRNCHENPYIQQLYKEFLGEP
jgi:hypothetical protein